MTGLNRFLIPARRRLGITRAETIRRCVTRRPDLVGWHERALAFWENGERVPTLEQFAVLAEVLNLSPTERLEVLHWLSATAPAATEPASA